MLHVDKIYLGKKLFVVISNNITASKIYKWMAVQKQHLNYIGTV